MAASKSDVRKINLALQGGGAHGAFTWGVLDRLLSDGRIEIEGITGTSAGAMNGAVLANGYAEGGAEGARAHLKEFWRTIAQFSRASPVQRTIFDVLFNNYSLDHSPGYLAMDIISRFASPYDFNPLNLNPLRDLVERTIDFDKVHKCKGVKLFVAATDVFEGKVKVFGSTEVTSDALMASACLPQMFHAVEIDGIPYWDGGFMGNPPLFPLFYECNSDDTLLVQINPVERRTVPRSAREILDRVNEITFNSSLLRELRTIEFVGRMIREERLDPKKYRDVKLHRIDGGDDLIELSASSKLNAEWGFLRHLRDIGRMHASAWLDAHFDDIGKRGTLDLRTMFETKQSLQHAVLPRH
ncbi:MAG: patatin-like phospholipase family protein [Pseudomonadota bacterium]